MTTLYIQDTGTLKVVYRGYTIRSDGQFHVEIIGPEPDGGYFGLAQSIGQAQVRIDQLEDNG